VKLPGRLGDRRVLAIDWDRESIRIIHATTGRKGPGRVRGFLVPIADGVDVDDAESLGRFIGRALKQRRIRTKRAIVAISRDQAVLHMLSLPNVPTEEMPSVVHFQITKELPFALEEARIDFATFPAEAEAENVDVLVAAVRNEVLEHHQAVCQSAGLSLERVGLRPFANTVAATYGRESVPEGCVLFVDVGPALTEIDLVRGGRLAFSRAASVNVPVMPAIRVDAADEETPPLTVVPTEAEQQEAVDNLLLEVNRTIEAYRVSDPGAEIARIVVAGSCGIEQRLCTETGRRFGATAHLYNPGDTIDHLAARGGEMTAFSAPLGLTIGHGTEGALHFDFLHPKEPTDVSRAKVRKVPVIAATVVLFIVAAVVLRGNLADPRIKEVNALKARVAKLKKEAKAVESFEDEVRSAEAWAKRDVVWLDQLATVTKLFPDTREAYVTKLIARDDGTIRIRARAKDRNRLLALRKEFEEKGPYVAELGTTKQVTDRHGFSQESEIVLMLKTHAAAKERAKESKSKKRSKRRT